MATPERVQIYVGSETKTEIMLQVLAYSILKRTQRDVDIVPMRDGDPLWQIPEGLPKGTGFSLRRWLIPSRREYQGRAIYLDADQLCLSDIWDLWSAPEQAPAVKNGTSAWMTFQPDKFSRTPWPQSSVMVIDCAAARDRWGWRPEEMFRHLRQADPGRRLYVDFMHGTWMKPPPAMLPGGDCWNSFNVQRANTRLLHYTREPDQPIYKPDHPFAEVWRKELVEAIKAGAVDKTDFEVALGRFGKQEDWRQQNGLHPLYAKYLSLFPQEA